eukprot:Rmarinus@m.5531
MARAGRSGNGHDIALDYDLISASSPKDVMQIRLSSAVLQILQANPTDCNIHIRFGERTSEHVLVVNGQEYSLQAKDIDPKLTMCFEADGSNLNEVGRIHKRLFVEGGVDRDKYNQQRAAAEAEMRKNPALVLDSGGATRRTAYRTPAPRTSTAKQTGGIGVAAPKYLNTSPPVSAPDSHRRTATRSSVTFPITRSAPKPETLNTPPKESVAGKPSVGAVSGGRSSPSERVDSPASNASSAGSLRVISQVELPTFGPLPPKTGGGKERIAELQRRILAVLACKPLKPQALATAVGATPGSLPEKEEVLKVAKSVAMFKAPGIFRLKPGDPATAGAATGESRSGSGGRSAASGRNSPTTSGAGATGDRAPSAARTHESSPPDAAAVGSAGPATEAVAAVLPGVCSSTEPKAGEETKGPASGGDGSRDKDGSGNGDQGSGGGSRGRDGSGRRLAGGAGARASAVRGSTAGGGSLAKAKPMTPSTKKDAPAPQTPTQTPSSRKRAAAMSPEVSNDVSNGDGSQDCPRQKPKSDDDADLAGLTSVSAVSRKRRRKDAPGPDSEDNGSASGAQALSGLRQQTSGGKRTFSPQLASRASTRLSETTDSNVPSNAPSSPSATKVDLDDDDRRVTRTMSAKGSGELIGGLEEPERLRIFDLNQIKTIRDLDGVKVAEIRDLEARVRAPVESESEFYAYLSEFRAKYPLYQELYQWWEEFDQRVSRLREQMAHSPTPSVVRRSIVSLVQSESACVKRKIYKVLNDELRNLKQRANEFAKGYNPDPDVMI